MIPLFCEPFITFVIHNDLSPSTSPTLLYAPRLLDEGKDQEKVTPQQNPKTRITRPSPLLGASVSSPSSLAISPGVMTKDLIFYH